MHEYSGAELLGSVRAIGRHMRGESIAGAMVREFPQHDVKAIRERVELALRQFACCWLLPPKHCRTGNRSACVRQGTWVPQCQKGNFL